MTTDKFETPLLLAVNSGQTPLIELLVSKGNNAVLDLLTEFYLNLGQVVHTHCAQAISWSESVNEQQSVLNCAQNNGYCRETLCGEGLSAVDWSTDVYVCWLQLRVQPKVHLSTVLNGRNVHCGISCYC
jgi:hypothetical protein